MKDFIKKRLREEIIDGQYMTPAMKTACNKMTIGSYEEALKLTKEAIKHLNDEKKSEIMEKLRQPFARLKDAQNTLDDEINRYHMTGDSLADEADTYWHQIQSTICELGPSFQ
jgi:hypothetical protein